MVNYFKKREPSYANTALPNTETFATYKNKITDGLAGQDLSGKSLTGLSFRVTDCSNTIFRNADLSWADFSHTNLTGADFSGANIFDTRFDFTSGIKDANFGPVILLLNWDDTVTNLTFWTSIWGGIVIKLGASCWFGPGAFERARQGIITTNRIGDVDLDLVISYFEAKWTLFNTNLVISYFEAKWTLFNTNHDL
jgi:hypothetical protein